MTHGRSSSGRSKDVNLEGVALSVDTCAAGQSQAFHSVTRPFYATGPEAVVPLSDEVATYTAP